VYDVAERAGVSIATVSFTFRRPDRVRNSTREAVLAAARALGYLPSASARGLADGRTGALGLYSFDYLLDGAHHDQAVGVPAVDTDAGASASHDDPNEGFRLFPLYVDEVQRGVELECWRRGYALMIGGGSHVSREAVVTDVAGRVDGLAVFPRTVPHDVLKHISRRIPVVEVSEPSDEDALSHVTVDNFTGMRALTEHLVQDHGLRDLLFIGTSVMSDIEARFKGFQASLHAAGLRVARQPLALRGDVGNPAAMIIGDLVGAKTLPEGVVCATDQDALAIMDALADAGIDVPRQVAVTGFDGIVAGCIARPTLTTVRQPMEQMGRAVVDILIKRLAHPEDPPLSRQLPVQILLRESCGCRTALAH